jgi:hypothetical protein
MERSPIIPEARAGSIPFPRSLPEPVDVDLLVIPPGPGAVSVYLECYRAEDLAAAVASGAIPLDDRPGTRLAVRVVRDVHSHSAARSLGVAT